MHNPYAAPRAGLELPAAMAGQARPAWWNGRIGRLRFLAHCLAGFSLPFCFGVLLAIVAYLNKWQASEQARIAGGLLLLAMPLLALLVATRRRLHDLEVSAWWGLFLLFPFLQFVFLIYLLIAPGKPEANRFGPAPAPNTPALKGGMLLSCLVAAGFIALRSL